MLASGVLESANPRWAQDPIFWLGAVFVVSAHGLVFFAGEYLPYTDWANHIGLISVFAHGGESGSLEYLERSWAPNPYFLFYFASAVLAQIMPVVTAAKLCLLAASLGMSVATAHLLEAHGRDHRMALVAPAALFGQAMGYGFASFVFSMPLLLWALAELEYLLLCLAETSPTSVVVGRRALRFAIAIALCYLGHALIFLAAAVLVTVRVAVFVVLAGSTRLVALRRAMIWCGLAFGPALVLGLIRLVMLWLEPARVTDMTPVISEQPWLVFPEWLERWRRLRWDLLDRGPKPQMRSMISFALVFGLIVVVRFRRSIDRPRLRGGYAAIALTMVALWMFGPNSIERPFSVWLFYTRFATLAALSLFLWPRVDLHNRRGLVLVVGILACLADDASLQRAYVLRHQDTAKLYDAVRAAVPLRSRILALSYGLEPDDPVSAHETLQKLHFHHLADGAAYTAYLFDTPLIPVHHRSDVAKPRAPFWRTPWKFDPKTDGLDYDLLILRGAAVQRAKQSSHHRLRTEINGWYLFETVPPPPLPSRATARSSATASP